MEDGEVERLVVENGEVAILESEVDMTAARYTGAPAPTVMSKNTRGQAILSV